MNVNYSEKLQVALRNKELEKECVTKDMDPLPEKVLDLDEVPPWIKRYIEINEPPLPYQLEGVKWMTEQRHGGILHWEPGMGKTYTTLLHINLVYSMCNLVICNKSQLIVWQEEIKKFYDDRFSILLAHKEIGVALHLCTKAQLENHDIVLTTYESITQCYRYPCDFQHVYWNNVYCDEIHRVRNSNTELYVMINKIKRKKFWGLTGSLIFNAISDARNIQSLINEDSIYSLSNISSLRLKDVGIELPTLHMHCIYTGFTKKQREWYNDYERRGENIVNDLRPKNKTWGEIFAIITMLRQITIAPKLLEDTHDFEASDREGYLSPRIDTLANEISQTEDQGVVFCFFRKSLELLKRNLRERGIRCKVIKAEHSTDEKKKYLKMFRENKFQILLVTYKTGGLGLNLTNACNVFLLSIWWNMQVIQQAIKRCFRPGQIKETNVYMFLTRMSIEERMLEICKGKHELSNNFLMETYTGFKPSKETMKLLFKR